jgi:esterase/lipase superfamily enzyme
MKREYYRWHSASLNRDMELLAFGESGARIIAFPTSMGRFFDWEDRGLVGALGEHLERGWLQLFCVDSVDGESWYAKGRPPAERIARHMQYDSYLLNEVVPFTARQNTNPFLVTAGASFGAYHAVNFALRYPKLVNRTIGLSGAYNIRHWADGYSNDDLYFNSPLDFIVNEHEPDRLTALQQQDIILAIGRDDPSCASNQQLSGILWSKGIGNALRIWDGWCHDWPYWQKMLQLYIGGHD